MSKTQHYASLHSAVQRYIPASNQMELEKFLHSIMSIESGGSTTAKNKDSGAAGLFQFVPGTWAAYGNGKNVFDAEAQCDAVVRLARDNAKEIKKGMHLTRDLNAGEYYLGHFAGSSGAIKVMSADPSTPLSHVLSAKAMSQNASTTFHGKKFGQFTVGDLRAWADTKMNVDIDARYEYQERHDKQATTADQDAQEAAERKRILSDFGVSKDVLNKIPLDGLLGKIFFVLISFLMEGAATAKEREMQPKQPTADVMPENVNTLLNKPMTKIQVPVASR